MYLATLKLPGDPDPRVLAAILDALAVANCHWTLNEWANGVDPPCCLDCARVVWVPDRPSQAPTFAGGPEILRMKRASCGSVAAYEAGRKQAEAVRNGATFDEAQASYGVVLVDDTGESYAVGGPVGSGYGSSSLRTTTPHDRTSAIRRRQLSSDIRGSARPHLIGADLRSTAALLKPAATRYWHAVVRTPTGLHDPTKDMVRG